MPDSTLIPAGKESVGNLHSSVVLTIVNDDLWGNNQESCYSRDDWPPLLLELVRFREISNRKIPDAARCEAGGKKSGSSTVLLIRQDLHEPRM